MRLAMAMTPERAADVCDSGTRARIEETFDVVWGSSTLDARELRTILQGADAVVTSWGTPSLPTELLTGGHGPRVVAHAAGTVKKILPADLIRRGEVTVFSAATRIAWSVGEYCLAACLSTLRDLNAYDRDMRSGHWRSAGLRGQELRGRRVGLIGASATARAFRRLLEPFDVSVAVYDPFLTLESARDLRVDLVSLQEVMRAEIVSVHVPAVAETAGMITADLLGLMPDGGLFLNSARAAAVETGALEAEVLTGRLRAVLDVFDPEPPNIGSELRASPNVLLTPHIAGDSESGHQALVKYVLDDALEFLSSGRHGPSWVDPTRWEISA